MPQLFQTPEQANQTQQNYADLTAENQSIYGAEQQRRRSLAAGFRSSFTVNVLDEVTRGLNFKTDPTFNAQAAILADEEVRKEVGLGLYDPSTREGLAASRSVADYAERKAYLAKQQADAREVAMDPVAGIAGGLLADAPLAFLTGAGGAIAGRVATAARLGSNVANAAAVTTDATLALGESALAAYALQQGNPNVTAADLGFAVIGVAGATLHGVRTVTKNGKQFIQSSPDAPSVRTAGDTGSYRNPAAESTELDAPVTIRPGEQHATFTTIKAPEGDIKVRVSADAGDGRATVRLAQDGTPFIDARPSIHSAGVVVNTVSDILKQVPDAAVRSARVLVNALKNAEGFSSYRGAVAASFDAAEATRLNPFLASDKQFLLGLQDPEFARTVQRLNLEGGNSEVLKDAIDYFSKQDAAPNFRSEFLQELNNDDVVNAARTANADNKLKQNVVEKILSVGGNFLRKHSSRHDRVAYAGEQSNRLANELFTNGSQSGSRIDSAADYKRTFELQQVKDRDAVGNALRDVVRNLEGVNVADEFTDTAKYTSALYKHADNITRFMQTQYQLERRGEVLQQIPEEYAEAIDAIQNWSRSRREFLSEVGQDGVEQFSDWYIPIRYDYAETQAILASKGITSDNAISDLFSQALRADFPGIDEATVKKAADAFQERVTGAGFQTKRELADILAESGDELQDALRPYVNSVGQQGTPLTQNLRRRTGINTSTKYIVDGAELSLQDLMNKDFISAMSQYDSALQGKAALRAAGYDNLSQLNTAVARAQREVPAKDLANWKDAIENGIREILGQSQERVPPFVQLLNKAASATLLRNSGIYQAVDTGFIHMQFGAKAILKARSREFKALSETLKDKQAFQQLDAIFEGAVINDSKSAAILRKIENTLNLQGGDRALAVANNAASSVQTLNGMRIAQKFQQGQVAGLIRLQLHNVLTGTGKDLAAARKTYKEIGGLSDAELDAIRATGDGALGTKLQQRLNNAHSRMLDTIVQQPRVGELPAWASDTSAGRILVGFGRFALLSWNKVLRRISQERGVLNGIASAALYTMPWMILAQSLIAVRDGKFFDKDGEPKWDSVLAKSASSLTVWGPGSALADALFGTGKANFGNPGFDWFSSALQVPSKVLSLDERAGSAIGKAVPFLGMIPAATYMLDEGFSAAAAERDALLEDINQ